MQRILPKDIEIAVLVPCFNEEATVAKVVADFRAALPGAAIWVYDNNSTDNTVDLAKSAGAHVARETRQGKGHVVRRMFADIDADIYLMVDGDDTYEAQAAPQLVERLVSGPYDLVNGARAAVAATAYRRGHSFGNYFLTGMVAWLFGRQTRDMLSGYKAFTRRYVKSFPAVSQGFEIETELMVHALELDMPVSEIVTPYRDRPENSASKLSTLRDGFRILFTILRLVETERPLLFFTALAAVFAALSLGLGIPVVIEFLLTGLVERFPTAMLAGFLGILATFALFAGIILDQTRRTRHEIKRLFYLSLPALHRPGR